MIKIGILKKNIDVLKLDMSEYLFYKCSKF